MKSFDWKKQFVSVYWLLSVLYWEILTHTAMFQEFRGSFFYGLGLSAAFALLIAWALSLLPGKWTGYFGMLFSFGGTVLY